MDDGSWSGGVCSTQVRIVSVRTTNDIENVCGEVHEMLSEFQGENKIL